MYSNCATLITKGTTHSISKIIPEAITRVAVHITDYNNLLLEAASVPATTLDNTITFTLTQEVTRRLPEGNAVMRVSYEYSEARIGVFYVNVFVLDGDGIADATGTPNTGGGGGGVVSTFVIRAGVVDSPTDFARATAIATDTGGTTVTTPPAEAGQYVALVFPADRPPATLVNTGIGTSALDSYTLQPRQDGGQYIYTLGPLAEGATFTYRISY